MAAGAEAVAASQPDGGYVATVVASANALLAMLAEIPYCDEQHPRVRLHVRRCESAIEAGDLEAACNAANAATTAADRARWERLHGPVGAARSPDRVADVGTRPLRSRSRARERRPGQRRRAVARTGPDDPDLADLARRRRERAS